MLSRLHTFFYGVPHSFKEFWVAGAIYMKKRPEGTQGCELIEVNRNNGHHNAVVPLLRKNGKTYFYKITECYCAPGDDHIISPWSFDFRFHHAERADLLLEP